MALDRLAVIAKLITERPLCADCVSRGAAIASDELPAYLNRMRSWFTVHNVVDRCRSCFHFTTVFSLSLTPR